MLFLIKILGFLLSLLPRFVIRGICVVVARLIYIVMPSRKRLVLNSLNHFNPSWSERELHEIANESAARTVEMGIFSLVSPFFSEKKLKKLYKFDTTEIDKIVDARERPIAGGVPHFSQMEAETVCKIFSPILHEKFNLGVFYRPFKSKALEKWVKTTRERFGVKLLSRKAGLVQAKSFLNSAGALGILFDQSPGYKRGILSLYDGRVTTNSEFLGATATHANAVMATLYIERTGVFSGVFHFEILRSRDQSDAFANTCAYNDWLLEKMRGNKNLCADWLWLHDRWKGFELFIRPHNKNFLPQTLEYYGLKSLPKNFRLWIRLPNWLGDIVMALPLIQTLRRERPDAQITLLARKHFLPMLEQLGVGDRLIALPPKGKGYYKFFKNLRHEHPDSYVLFTNSLRGDLEARLTGAKTIFGMVRKGHPRPLLTKPWRVPADLDLTKNHQTRVWEKWFQAFHLAAPLDLSPILLKNVEKKFRVGLICGTENSPEKRWPIERWRELISQLISAFPQLEIFLFGTAKDGEITAKVAAGMPENVVDRAGKTDLPSYMRELSSCRALCCNDTGGMHLANMLGVPVIVIFGPTNPVRTGPIFDAPKFILQPDGCPATGGMDISLVPAKRAFEAIAGTLK